MAEGIAFAIEKIGEYLVAPVGRQFKYLFCYNSIINNLKDEVKELKLMTDGEQMRVDEATNNVQEINPLVGDWMSKVEEISTLSEIILEDTVKAKNGCLNGRCPNLKSRYLLGRRATKKSREIVELKGKGKFDWVSCHVAPLATMAPSYSSTCFESRKSTEEEIINALKDPKINVIGVSGMGGVGKTTMVKEVSTRVRVEGLFDEVAMAIVSQNQDVFKIQGELGDELSLRFDEWVSIRARANKLRTRLKSGKRVLIILDDLWEGLDLGEVGLPIGGDCKGCKVLLTSRIERVCEETGTQRSFVVQVLSVEEAWDLFKVKAGNCVNNYDLNPIAKEVANECCGLPIAIVTLAAALKDRRKHAWSDALQQLRNSTATNIPGMHKKVYSSIELSYNFLESDQAKSLLLLCCLFPEDQVVSVTSLVGYVMGLRIFDDVETLLAKRDRVCSLVDELINCHLLIDADNHEEIYVKVHDVIRDVGISIASKEGKLYLTKSDTKLIELSQSDMHKCYNAICLVSNEILKLPIGLDFSMLHLLILKCNHSPPALLTDSFGKMEHLKVIVVIGMDIDSLAQSLHFSLNLSTLRLEMCELQADISFVGSMQNLEILSFRGSNLDVLPSTLGQLGNLKCLDLRCRSGPTTIPFGVLSGLKKLEELYMGDYFLYASRVEDDKQGNGGAIVTELTLLSRLNVLQIAFSNLEVMQKLKNFPFENLIRFDFDMLKKDDGYRFSNRVSLNKINVAVVSETNISVLVRRAARLTVCEVGNLKNLFEDLYLLKGVIQPPSLANLTFLQIEKCDAIKGLFSKPVVKCLVQLQHLFIIDCEMVEEVISQKTGDGINDTRKIIFPKLQDLILGNLPRFRNIYLESEDIIGTQNNSDTIQTLFNQQVILPSLKQLAVDRLNELLNVAASDEIVSLQNLQDLKVRHCDSIKVVFDFKGLKVPAEEILLGQLNSMTMFHLPKLAHIWKMVPKGIKVFQTLRFLQILQCESLRYLFSPSMAKVLVNLQELIVENCCTLEQIINEEEEEEEEEEETTDTIVFPQLQTLKLKNLRNLNAFMITREINGFEFPLLEKLIIKRCNNMKNFYSGAVSVAKLEEVKIGKGHRVPMGADLNGIIHQWVWRQ